MNEHDDNLFEDGCDEINEIIKNNEMLANQKALKSKIAYDNYDNLIDKGIDIEGMRKQGYDLSVVTKTLTLMLDIFKEDEEYEKCKVLFDILEKI